MLVVYKQLDSHLFGSRAQVLFEALRCINKPMQFLPDWAFLCLGHFPDKVVQESLTIRDGTFRHSGSELLENSGCFDL